MNELCFRTGVGRAFQSTFKNLGVFQFLRGLQLMA